MAFHTQDRVVHPTHGVGSVLGLVTKSFPGNQTRQYYEIAIHRGTVWVPVEACATTGLRLLTARADLPHYRGVLLSRPTALTRDFRQRGLDLRGRLRLGVFQDLCEVVRDLAACGWRKTLGEADSVKLRQARDELCRQWAAADGVSLSDATREVHELLSRCQQAYQTQ
jgi:RNA polymerase-interacting CarD/CdnL/TRCF family regulator